MGVQEPRQVIVREGQLGGQLLVEDLIFLLESPVRELVVFKHELGGVMSLDVAIGALPVIKPLVEDPSGGVRLSELGCVSEESSLLCCHF